MYRRLLVPLDGSQLAEAVLPLAARLGKACQASVLLLHVLERGAPAAVHGDRHLRALDEAEAYLAEVAAGLRAQGVIVETHAHEVPEGHVPRSIAAHAGEEGADLIVISTHGSGGLQHILFGSVAQQVLGQTTVPVLLTRPSADSVPARFEPQRILVPLDRTQFAERALEPAVDIARLLGASIHLVTVVPTVGTTRGELQAVAQVLPTSVRATLELEEEEAAEYLDDVASRLRAQGVQVTTEVRRGETAALLAQEAAEPDVGLVVLATHGRAGMRAAFAGSIADRLLDHTHLPILLLRLEER
jgi:nucleotide-binding universal stress UspA family protein